MVLYEIFVIDRGGGRTPQTLSPVGRFPGGEKFGQLPSGKFTTKAEAERAAREGRVEFATRDNPVGVRPVPTPKDEATFERHDGRQVTGPAPKGKRTTRTPEEEQRVLAKSRELAAINVQIERGGVSAVEKTKLIRERQELSRTPVQEVKIAFGGTTKDATPSQIAEAKRTGQDVFIDGERIPAKDIGKARRVGVTRGGGTFNIPKSATFFPGFTGGLTKPTGEEKAEDIIPRFRRQEIDV